MSKKPINEGIVERALTAIWSALLAGKKDRLMKSLERDPEFKASVERLAKLQKELQDYMDEKKKTPEGAEFDNWYNEKIKGAGL